MKRIGRFTNTVYNEDYDTSKITECCTLVEDKDVEEQTCLATNMKRKLECLQCMGCPTAKNYIAKQ